MEKQLLFLLDWDLRISTEDLYYHLEPFLAPIRVYQARKAEQARLAEQRSRSRLDVSYQPASYSSYSSHPSSRAASRTPSLSPPSRSSSASTASDSPDSFSDYDAGQSAHLVHIQHSLPLYEDKPSKKAKASGGFFNRMFGAAPTNGTYRAQAC